MVTGTLQVQPGILALVILQQSVCLRVSVHVCVCVCVCVCVKLLQSCPTLCDLMNCNSPGSSVHGIPGKNPGLGRHALLQGIFPTQG